jgi:hypothetical protein
MFDGRDDRHPIRSPHQHVYDLSEPKTAELTREFLKTKTIAGSERFVCFRLEGSDPFSNIARQIEREVFEEEFGNDSATMAAEYGPYEQSSVFFMTVDMQKTAPAGVLRMIRNSPAGLKTLIDMEDSSKTARAVPTEEVMRYHGIDDLDRCWDFATAAIPRRYRRRMMSLHMRIAREWYVAAVREDIQHFVSIMDSGLLKLVRGRLSMGFVPLANSAPFSYLGSQHSEAVYAHFPTIAQRLQDFRFDKNFPASKKLSEIKPHAG